MATKNGGKMILGKKWWMTLCIPCGPKILSKCSSCTVSQINVILRFIQKFKMAANNGGKMNFGKKCHMTHIPGRPKISLKSLTHHF